MAYKSDLIEKDIEAYLKEHESKELLRFTTVGSVDDGKSTLIGRLLYDTGEVYEDQIASAREASTKDSEDEGIDLALITDGLKAEREQGITIDVAYRYFTTERRKFIIADTPGHVQYTRNMATGASTADAAIILIDARMGVLEQSRRHAFIASLLKIPNLLVAVNKMDLKDYDENVFNEICKDFERFSETLSFEEVVFFPVSALKGDNIVNLSSRTPWYKGATILEYLETVPLQRHVPEDELCLPVQYVIRPHLDFRGFAGTIAKGVLTKGREIVVLPSYKRSRIKSIETFNGEIEQAFAPSSVTITLEDNIDISRGDIIVYPDSPMVVRRQVEADIVWMNENKLETGKQYLIKQATNLVPCTIESILHVVNMETLAEEPAKNLELNNIGKVRVNISRPLVIDLYRDNRQAGAFILIDRMTNATVAAGMINGYDIREMDNSRGRDMKVSLEERTARFHQKASMILVTGESRPDIIKTCFTLERHLFDRGHLPMMVDPRKTPKHIAGDDFDHLLKYLESGMLVIAPFITPTASHLSLLEENLPEAELLEVFVAHKGGADAGAEVKKKNGLVIEGASTDVEVNQSVEDIIEEMQKRNLLI